MFSSEKAMHLLSLLSHTPPFPPFSSCHAGMHWQLRLSLLLNLCTASPTFPTTIPTSSPLPPLSLCLCLPPLNFTTLSSCLFPSFLSSPPSHVILFLFLYILENLGKCLCTPLNFIHCGLGILFLPGRHGMAAAGRQAWAGMASSLSRRGGSVRQVKPLAALSPGHFSSPTMLAFVRHGRRHCHLRNPSHKCPGNTFPALLPPQPFHINVIWHHTMPHSLTSHCSSSSPCYMHASSSLPDRHGVGGRAWQAGLGHHLPIFLVPLYPKSWAGGGGGPGGGGGGGRWEGEAGQGQTTSLPSLNPNSTHYLFSPVLCLCLCSSLPSWTLSAGLYPEGMGVFCLGFLYPRKVA